MDPFIGEIRPFAFNFAPTQWALCNGQLLSISQNTALFSLLGTFYGGNGTSNFALPNLQGNVAIGFGNGAGLTPRSIGETGGEAGVAIQSDTMPAHLHGLNGDGSNATTNVVTQALPATAVRPVYSPSTQGGGFLAADSAGAAGGGLPHNNLQPYVVINYCIALSGVFPSRS